MVIWGGSGDQGLPVDTGGRYDPVADTWTATSTGANVPDPRIEHTAVWTGTEMIVWGGKAGTTQTQTGGRYDPTHDAWTATSTGTGAPTARYLHTAVWTGSRMIVWGGWSGAYASTGSRYDPGADAWTATAAGPTGRYAHAAVWTGARMVVWGGTTSGGHTNTGSRYDPTGDSWASTSTAGSVASARSYPTAVWTGSSMIVWGGTDGTALGTGSRYDPASDVWTAVSAGAGAPAARAHHSAIWTGTEMIVWGGSFTNVTEQLLGDGGRYAPGTDAWSPVSTEGAPAARDDSSAVFTGERMMVWGGRTASGSAASGGRYCAATCTAPAPTGSPSVTVSKSGTAARVSWSALAGADSYDLVRGGLVLLRSSGGNFTTSTGACLANDAAATSYDDAATPPAADGYWYLVRGSSCGGPGTYDSGAPRQQGSRDDEIAASASACP